MKSLYLPILLTVFGGVCYHIAQKSIPKTANPLFAIIIAYITGMLICFSLLLFFPSTKSLSDTVKELDWSMFLVGIGAVMIEVGFLLVYRTGWDIGTTGTLIGVSISVLLLPVGILVYKESISNWNLIGVVLCLLGLFLISRK